jgi:hypothetical protein
MLLILINQIIQPPPAPRDGYPTTPLPQVRLPDKGLPLLAVLCHILGHSPPMRLPELLLPLLTFTLGESACRLALSLCRPPSISLQLLKGPLSHFQLVLQLRRVSHFQPHQQSHQPRPLPPKSLYVSFTLLRQRVCGRPRRTHERLARERDFTVAFLGFSARAHLRLSRRVGESQRPSVAVAALRLLVGALPSVTPSPRAFVDICACTRSRRSCCRFCRSRFSRACTRLCCRFTSRIASRDTGEHWSISTSRGALMPIKLNLMMSSSMIVISQDMMKHIVV